jgi:hypothetical protein
MKETTLSIPELMLVGATRGILGVGIGLFIANHLSESQRKPLAYALVGIGAATTLPLAMEILNRKRVHEQQ